jgi:quinoprotein glucose dehydrogenase
MPRLPRLSLCLGVILSSILADLRAVGGDPPAYRPYLAKASDEAERAIKRFTIPTGIEAHVWASEPMLAHPVSFTFDEHGRCFVAETFRLHQGVTDNRNHMNWLDDDIACRTVEDRVDMYRRFAKDMFSSVYETHHDRIRLLEDTEGKGRADGSRVFADGFHNAAEGIGAGVLARRGSLYYTCIPDLWLLNDPKGTGSADARQSLARGFGVHVAFLGHDLHGLRMGPDGRLYFSCGDRGLNVTTKEGNHLFLPDCGAVLRCEPDGSNLEIVHTGLRNPQELAFDEWGNLFTVDNNSDSGDQARLTQIVEGGDSGWRMSYQYGTAMGNRGPFNAEKIWHLSNQPAYIVPPLGHISAGPSGLCHHPGVAALPERYKHNFFLCDFRGSGTGSGVWAFSIKPKGASFEIDRREQFIWNILGTDCDFGPDGLFYISDWVEGWGLTGKGRIYRFADPEAARQPAVSEVKKLISDGFEHRLLEELAKLLAYPDQRVRQEAQFALAEKGKKAIPILIEAAQRPSGAADRLARIHALWALGQVARAGASAAVAPIVAATADNDSEMRAQAAHVLGDIKGLKSADAAGQLTALIHDAEPRVRFFAALSAGNMAPSMSDSARSSVAAEVTKMIEADSRKDPYLRHAAVVALAKLGERETLAAAASQSSAVRMVALLALRRLQSKEVIRFLDDSEPALVLEAARAIHDLPISDGLARLAGFLSKSGQHDFLLWRALNSNFRLGTAECASAVAAFAARADAPEALRIEAVRMLGMWAKPPVRDRIIGDFRPLGERDAAIAVAALRPRLGGIFAGPDRVRKEAVTVAAKLGITEVAATLRSLVADEAQPTSSRVEALKGLNALKDVQLNETLAGALKSREPQLRAEARRLIALRQPEQAPTSLGQVLENGDLVEKQSAFGVLAELKSSAADELLSRWLERLNAGEVAPAIQLDLLEAAAQRRNDQTSRQLAAFEKSRPANDPLGKWHETLAGGDAERGRDVFLNKAEVTCVKCHKLNGTGGEVGPELAGIAGRPTPNNMPLREYLLESIVLPDKQIAKGYDTVVLELTNGKSVSGILKSETASEVKLITPDGQSLTIAKDKIEERRRGKSAMPDDLVQKLTKRELRDLIEFLTTLSEPVKER